MHPLEILRNNNPFYSSAAPEPWENHDYDVVSICANPFDNLFHLVKRKSDNPKYPIGILIKGEAGSGKTHLLARILRQCSDEKVNALFASVIPILNPSAPHYHLNREIIRSLGSDIPGKPRFTQIHRLVTEILKEYICKENLCKENANPIVFEKLEGDPWHFFQPIHENRSELEILADKTISWICGVEALVSDNFIRSLFAYCNDSQRHIARKWLYGEAIDEEEAKDIGVTYNTEWQTDAREEEMRQRLQAIATLASRYHLTILTCFDQLEDLDSKNKRSAFGHMIQTLINFCPGMLPVVLARMRYWETDLKPSLNQSVVEKIEMNSFIIKGCSQDQIDEVIMGRISSKFPDSWKELSDWLIVQMREILLQESISHPFPREVIRKANKIIMGNSLPLLKSENPIEILSLKYKTTIDELRCLDPHKWSLSKEQLLSAIYVYFSAMGWNLTSYNNSRTMLKISQKHETATILINTDSNHRTVGGYFTEGVKILMGNKKAYCILLADPRCTIRKASWVATGKKKEEFEKKGGYIYMPLYPDICRFYALEHLRLSVMVGDIVIDTGKGTRNITKEELNQFICSSLFGEPLMSIPPDNGTPEVDCTLIKDELLDLLRTGPSFIMNADNVHKKLSEIFPLSIDELLSCCKKYEDIFKIIGTGSRGLTIMLYGPSATC